MVCYKGLGSLNALQNVWGHFLTEGYDTNATARLQYSDWLWMALIQQMPSIWVPLYQVCIKNY